MNSMSSTGATSRGKRKAKHANDPVTAFARDVVAGKVVANKFARLACERHLKDLATGPARGLAWDLGKAMRAIEFFPVLRHYKGKWGRAHEPFNLSPFQQFQIGSIFGWVWAASGLRRFRTAYLEEPRKNGKTAKAAGIGLYLLVMDDEAGAEVYVGATKREQARLVWGDAREFVLRSPALRRRIEPFQHSLIAPASAGKFVPLSAEDKTHDGLNPSGVILDEVHRIMRSIVDVMKTAQGSREQPLQVEITTAGDNVESVCWEHHEYSKNVLEGLFEDDSWFAYIAAADADDDWTDERTWYKANPNLGISKNLDYMRSEFKGALNKPAEQPEFKRLHLGIWSESAGGWMPMDRWNAAAMKAGDDAHLKGRPCVAGVDLSATTDITAYVELYLPTAADPQWHARPFFWVPQAKVDRSRRGEMGDVVRYDRWLDEGLIFSTPGDVVDYDAVHAWVTKRADDMRLLDIGVDPWNATQFMTDLMNGGFPVVEVRQGYKTLSEPTKKLLELVLANKLRHDGHPAMRWMMSNVSIDRDPADNHKPSKKMSRQRIDGPVALIIALSRGLARLPNLARSGSVYGGVDLARIVEDVHA
jgi:phage terminase large subunit-like protein